MAKRSKNTKTYRVRVVNPAPPPEQRAHTIVTPRERNAVPPPNDKRNTGNYKLQYMSFEEPRIIVTPIGEYATGEQVTLYYPSPMDGEDAWESIRGDYDVGTELAKQGYDEYGNRLRNPKRGRRRRRNAEEASLTPEQHEILLDLKREATDSQDDWGITDAVTEYLRDADAGEDVDTPREFLVGVGNDVWWHFGHTGEEGEGADPMYSRASADRAAASISRAQQRMAKLENPAFRYAAVPVSDGGTETVHVARGHRRADMVRNVARSVPGDAMVDLQRTRTFGTKHEAQAYGSTISPRVRSLSRRIGS